MDEDEELYREMNEDDDYYMGDNDDSNDDNDQDNSPDEQHLSSNRGCTSVILGFIVLIYMLF